MRWRACARWRRLHDYGRGRHEHGRPNENANGRGLRDRGPSDHGPSDPCFRGPLRRYPHADVRRAPVWLQKPLQRQVPDDPRGLVSPREPPAGRALGGPPALPVVKAPRPGGYGVRDPWSLSAQGRRGTGNGGASTSPPVKPRGRRRSACAACGGGRPRRRGWRDAWCICCPRRQGSPPPNGNGR